MPLSALPTRPLRRRRGGTVLRLTIRRGAWRASTPAQRRWACDEISGVLRDLRAGYHPRAALRRARAARGGAR